MAQDGSSNTAIVAILVIVAIGLFIFFSYFYKDNSTTVIEKPSTVIEAPSKIIEKKS